MRAARGQDESNRGLAAAVLIGALAGLLPALKAARLSPTEALWTL
jgi:putative ABC transport system permease protein